jgi:subtilase family serine protease
MKNFRPGLFVVIGTAILLIAICGDGSNSSAQNPSDRSANLNQPDLSIKQFLFPPTNEKALRVQVENQGEAASKACRLILTVRKINGTPAGRQTHVNIPALAPGKTVWLLVDAKSILPVSISLEATTFRLNADATRIVAESDETNNEVWHNQ